VRGESASGTAVVGVATAPGGQAARFSGPVTIEGSLTVVGGPKSAAVPRPDGSLRRMYCLESTESWFEDFGSAVTSEGRAEVKLAPDFAELVRTDDYHVFLTAEGDSNGLYVAAKRADGFEVRESMPRQAPHERDSLGSVAFSYRVVAGRKDLERRRLEAVAQLAEREDEGGDLSDEMLEAPLLPEQPVLRQGT
jgi:hypothetical protein